MVKLPQYLLVLRLSLRSKTVAEPKYIIPFFVIHFKIIKMLMSLLPIIFSHRFEKKKIRRLVGHLQIHSKFVEHEMVT